MLVLGLIGIVLLIFGLLGFTATVSGYNGGNSTGVSTFIAIIGAVSLYLSIVLF